LVPVGGLKFRLGSNLGRIVHRKLEICYPAGYFLGQSWFLDESPRGLGGVGDHGWA
ncbi:hypothetical protein Dimus_023939, partial [Dionaea muscipula]